MDKKQLTETEAKKIVEQIVELFNGVTNKDVQHILEYIRHYSEHNSILHSPFDSADFSEAFETSRRLI